MATTFSDIHPDIIHSHILPRLDCPSLSATATASSALKSLCTDDTLWSKISKTTFPSTTHPRLHDVISTFPAGHRSFFHDAFPALITAVTNRHRRHSWPTEKSPCPSCNLHRPSHTPSQLISAVDIFYQNDVVFSKVKFTDITPDFLSSEFRLKLNSDDPTRNRSNPTRPGSGSDLYGVTQTIDLTVDEIAGADLQTLSHLKQSVTLNWILIDPTRKRAGNFSSIKPVSARQDWVTNETILRYITVLPGSEPDEIVWCRIQVVLGVGEKGVGLYVKEVKMKVQDLDGVSVNGVEFLKVAEGAIMEVNGVRRKVGDDVEERERSYKEFKEMKRERKEWEKKKEERKEMVIWFNYVVVFVSSFFSMYFLLLLLKKWAII